MGVCILSTSILPSSNSLYENLIINHNCYTKCHLNALHKEILSKIEYNNFWYDSKKDALKKKKKNIHENILLSKKALDMEFLCKN